MLDRTIELTATIAEAERPGEEEARAEPTRVRSVVRRTWHFFLSQTFSSLTRRIVFLNVAGLLALVIGILYLSQFRAGLIEARVQSLLVQGEIIASAIAASATVETDTITIDLDKLLADTIDFYAIPFKQRDMQIYRQGNTFGTRLCVDAFLGGDAVDGVGCQGLPRCWCRSAIDRDNLTVLPRANNLSSAQHRAASSRTHRP